MPVAIVIYERAAGIPALAVAGNASFVRHIGKRAVTIVVIKNVLAKVAHEEIFKAVVIVIADANTLPPAGVGYACLQSNICESAVTIVLEKMRCWLLAFGETFQARSIHQENIEPAVIVVIVESNATAGSLEKV